MYHINYDRTRFIDKKKDWSDVKSSASVRIQKRKKKKLVDVLWYAKKKKNEIIITETR